MSNLQELDLSNNKISKIEEGVFAKLSNLLKLDLSNNKISKIEEYALTGLMKLQKLNLSKNEIPKFLVNAFAGLRNLKKLNLSDNDISEIEEGVFAQLSNLLELNLSYNFIRKIAKYAFTGLMKLQNLDLSDNDISEIKKYAFTGLMKLQNLNLSKNEITELLVNAFAGLRNLKKLNLSDNDISEIEEGVFAKLSNLLKLDLSDNDISEIEEGVFAKLSNLLKLDLSENVISEIEEYAFTGLMKLQKLNLSKNEITELLVNAFAELRNLKKLNLSHNQIDEIKKNIFFWLSNLKDLDLSYNNSLKVRANAFAGLDGLGTLNLQNKNEINRIDANAFAGLICLNIIFCNKEHAHEIAANALDPLLCQIYKNTYLNGMVSVSFASIQIKGAQLIEEYIKHRIKNDKIRELCREYCLTLLLNNRLQEPEAISLLVDAIYTGNIPIANIINHPSKHTLDWICKLLNDHNLPILAFLAKNKGSFTSKEFEAVTNQIAFIVPPSSTEIEGLLEKQLMAEFSLIKKEIDPEQLSTVINTFITGGGVAQQVDEQIRKEIRSIIELEDIHPTEEQIGAILIQVESMNDLQRQAGISTAVAIIIPDFADLVKFNEIKKRLTDKIAAIGKVAIQQEIIKTNLEVLGIVYNEDHYAKLEKFIDFKQAVTDCEYSQLKELADRAWSDIEIFNDVPEVYSNLILNCLPFLTYKYITYILKTNQTKITQECNKKLGVIIEYATKYKLNDEEPVKVLFINSNPKQVLLIEELRYLHPRSMELTNNINVITFDESNHEKIPLNTNNFKQIEINLPVWLSQQIRKYFTVANTLAKIITENYTKLIKQRQN